MLTLVILYCAVGTTDRNLCHMTAVAQGFVEQAQCEAYSPLMVAGWLKLNDGYEVRRSWCTATPEHLIGKWRGA